MGRAARRRGPVPRLPGALEGLRDPPPLRLPPRDAVVERAGASQGRRVGLRAGSRPRRRDRGSCSPVRAARRRSSTCLPRARSRLGTVAVLGNHDVAVTRDPFSGARELADLASAGAVLLRDESVASRSAGLRVQLVGTDPRAFMAETGEAGRVGRPRRRSAHPALPLPGRGRSASRAASFQLVLAGHLHGGPDLPARAGRQDPLRPPGARIPRGNLRARGNDAGGISRARHDLRCRFGSSRDPRRRCSSSGPRRTDRLEPAP